MLNLKERNLSYLLASADNINGLVSYLYSRDYQLLDIKGYYQGKFENSVLAFTKIDSNELRKDALHILKNYNQDCLILKYKDESNSKKIFENGQEVSLDIIFYNTDTDKKSYIYDGLSFSFVEQQLYFFPKNKEDFKIGMIVELFSNNNNWIEKRVINPEDEFNKVYNLMIRYNKIRIPV